MSAPVAAPRALRRDPANRVLGGVLAGWAEFLDIDRTVIRVAFVLLSILSAAFPGILAYLIMWALIPAKTPAAAPGASAGTAP